MALDPNSDAALEVSDKAEYMTYLKTAPIAVFADYAGISIDEAANRRVEAAKAESAFSMMDISVRPTVPKDGFYGFASVTVGCIKIDDFKILENKDGELFVGMPSKKDAKAEKGYRNTVFISKDLKDDFNMAVLGKYHEAVEKMQSRAASLAPDRMADRVAQAQQEADKHNADLPATEKGNRKRDRA